MQFSGFSRKFTGAALAIALCATPATAAGAVFPTQSISPLMAVSAYGSQASAQALCGSAVTAAAGAAAAAQPRPGCVLPVADVPPPVADGAPLTPSPTADFGINWILAGLGGLAVLAAIIAATTEDDDDGRVFPPPASPA